MPKKSRARAFSPGHITGFFEICDTSPNPYEQGSRGAGLNLSLGAFSTVEIIEEKKKRIDIILNGKYHGAPVTRYAVDRLLGKRNLHVVARVETQLPLGQGFGMSAAGSLSTTWALGHLLHLSSKEVLVAAHCAEVELRTGLGDVAAMSVGGFEIRETPGIGGRILSFPCDKAIVATVVGPTVRTGDILGNSLFRKRICEEGRKCTNALLCSPSLPHFFELSKTFVTETRLASPRVLQVLSSVRNYGHVSMCCLGNSLFALGENPKLGEELGRFGRVYCCRVDEEGVRLIG